MILNGILGCWRLSWGILRSYFVSLVQIQVTTRYKKLLTSFRCLLISKHENCRFALKGKLVENYFHQLNSWFLQIIKTQISWSFRMCKNPFSLLWIWKYFWQNYREPLLKSQLHNYYIWQFYNLESSNTKMFYDVKSFDTKLAMLYNAIFEQMASFINVFTKYLSKAWRKRCHILTQNFKIHFNMFVLLRHHLFLYLKFYVLFCFCHNSLFKVSLLCLFVNVFTRYL